MEFDRRISAESVGLLWTSHDNRRTVSAVASSEVESAVWALAGDELASLILSCFRPRIEINI